MAFASEHPVVAHSEFRPVGDIERSDARFEVVSPYEPAGDQPAAIAELEKRINEGEPFAIASPDPTEPSWQAVKIC